MQKSQNLLNYGDISLIESRISTNFFIEYRIRDPPPPPHPGPLIYQTDADPGRASVNCHKTRACSRHEMPSGGSGTWGRGGGGEILEIRKCLEYFASEALQNP